MGEEKAGQKPSKLAVHGALVVTQLLFGAGSVVGSLGLPAFNPLLFALLREGAAGPLLLLGSILLTGVTPWQHLGRGDRRIVGQLGVFIFANQLFFILGLKASSAVVGSIWQPSQPIMTAALAAAMGSERFTKRRVLGILIAFLGCASMVALSSHGAKGATLMSEVVFGNCCFFINCLASSAYVLRSKTLLKKYPSLCVTAWSYMSASVLMAIAAASLDYVPGALNFLCPDCKGRAWHVPTPALPALAYWVLCQSILAYALMTWGNQYVSGSLVSTFSVLQPVTAALLTAAILLTGAYADCAHAHDDDRCLNMPGLADLGALGVFAGLYLVVTSEDDAAAAAPSAGRVVHVDHSPLLYDPLHGDEALAAHQTPLQ